MHTNGDVLMKVIAVSVNKGGVGKTTLSKSLATAATDAGHLVLVIDMDTQQNALGWGRRRAEIKGKELPPVVFSTEKDLESQVQQAEKNGCDLVVIDTPPGRSGEAVAAMELADLVLIPCIAEDVDSFDGVPRVAKLALKSAKSVAAVLNCATPGSRTQEDTARAVMDVIGIPLAPAILHRFMIHRDANPKGLTAQEVDPNSKAAAEIRALWEWACAHLHMSTPAHAGNKGAA